MEILKDSIAFVKISQDTMLVGMEQNGLFLSYCIYP